MSITTPPEPLGTLARRARRGDAAARRYLRIAVAAALGAAAGNRDRAAVRLGISGRTLDYWLSATNRRARTLGIADLAAAYPAPPRGRPRREK